MFSLTSATHSTSGRLDATALSDLASTPLADDETIELVYEPSFEERADAQGRRWYLVLQRTTESAASLSPTTEQAADLPTEIRLYQNQPNPFSHATSLRFDLPRPTSVTLNIYDITGRKVRTLTSSDWPAGRHSLEWDHRNDAGVRLGPGAYIYRLQTGEFRAEKKMIVLP